MEEGDRSVLGCGFDLATPISYPHRPVDAVSLHVSGPSGSTLPHASDPADPSPPHASNRISPSPPPRRPADPSVLAKLETLISGVVDGVLGNGTGLELPMRVKRPQQRRSGLGGVGTAGGSGEDEGGDGDGEGDGGGEVGTGGKRWRVRFPGGSKREARRFGEL